MEQTRLASIPAQDGELEDVTVDIAQAAIEIDCAVILSADMKERRFAAGENALHDLDHEPSGVAVTEMIWMSADGADLSEAGSTQPLAGHGGQPSFFADTDVVAEFACMWTKWTGFGQHSKREHLRRIGGGKFDEISRSRWQSARRVYHLRHRYQL